MYAIPGLIRVKPACLNRLAIWKRSTWDKNCRNPNNTVHLVHPARMSFLNPCFLSSSNKKKTNSKNYFSLQKFPDSHDVVILGQKYA